MGNRLDNNSKMVSFRLTAKHIAMLNELSAATGRPKSEHLRSGIEAIYKQSVKKNIPI